MICLLALQPVLGLLHHRHYLKTQARGLVSYVHIWYGRVLIVLGVINGGLGLQLARESDGYIIAYGTVSGVVFFCYIGFKLCMFFRNPAPVVEALSPKDSSPKPPSVSAPRRPYRDGRHFNA